MVTHVLRYDDFSACSSAAVEERLAVIFLKHRVPCTFGVIPFACMPENLINAGEIKLNPLSPARADLLKPLLQAGLAEIALHGYAHLALAPMRGLQEFSQRMPRDTQRQLIQRGRAHLENLFGVRVRLYVPPWNKLAPATAAVLKEEGLYVSSGGPEVASPECLSLGQLPCPTLIDETSRALAAAQRHGAGRNCVGTVLHDYDFKESNLGTSTYSLNEFDAAVARWKNASPVDCKLISDMIAANPDAGGQKALANFNLRRTINARRFRRKLAGSLLNVYWNPQTAGKLAGRLKFVP